jgi:hypothetical protein
LGDTSVLLTRFKHIKQYENETLFDFQSRFEGTLCQIPRSHCPEDKYIVHLYTHVILTHLRFPLGKKGPRTLDEAYDMATGIERNISLSGIKDLFTSRIVEDMAEEMEPKKNDEVSTYAPPSDEAIQEHVSPA